MYQHECVTYWSWKRKKKHQHVQCDKINCSCFRECPIRTPCYAPAVAATLCEALVDLAAGIKSFACILWNVVREVCYSLLDYVCFECESHSRVRCACYHLLYCLQSIVENLWIIVVTVPKLIFQAMGKLFGFSYIRVRQGRGRGCFCCRGVKPW